MADPLVLTEEITAIVNGALDNNTALLLAAVDAENKPVLSFRGSAAVFSADQISIWARNAEGGTISAIEHNPNVALAYRSPTVPLLQFIGRARMADDEATRERAFSLAHAREQASDPERKGRAILVDLDAVRGVLRFEDGKPVFVNMAR
jgi:hypothetical protein